MGQNETRKPQVLAPGSMYQGFILGLPEFIFDPQPYVLSRFLGAQVTRVSGSGRPVLAGPSAAAAAGAEVPKLPPNFSVLGQGTQRNLETSLTWA